MDLTILYRGPLSSCNYGCGYCPFAKREESHAELEGDRRALERFGQWVAGETGVRIGVLFTPWGEALIRTWYQKTIARLSHSPNVRRVAIQTNLSCRLDWLSDCDLSCLALWTTYHPGETTRLAFMERCEELLDGGVRFSAGVVGLREHLGEIEALREALPPSVYVWVNAYKDRPDYYSDDEVARIEAVDPYFRTNLSSHPSQGHACRTGQEAISVDGEGTIRRCHFVREPIGNIYDPQWREALCRRPCPNETCGCHIGYVHLPELRQYERYGEGLLERIPDAWDFEKSVSWRQDSARGL